MIRLIENRAARDAVVAKIDAAKKVINMAPATKGRLAVSFGIPATGGTPQVAVSCDADGVWRFYDTNSTGAGCLVHEQRADEGLTEWARGQSAKF